MTTSTTAIRELTAQGLGTVGVQVTDRGAGRPVLLLHGGGVHRTVSGLAEQLVTVLDLRVLTPTHPGFEGTARPAGLESIGGLAALYLALCDQLDLTDVTVIGNSIGGWIAAEMAIIGSPRLARVVLIGATGIEVPGHPVAQISFLPIDAVMRLSYHDPEPFRVDPTTLPPDADTIMAANMAALDVYGGQSGANPALLQRLSTVGPATLVLWGDSDQIVDPDYGRAYADAIPGAEFRLLTRTGHLPQIETPDQVLGAIADFLTSHAAWTHDYTVETTVPPAAVWATLRDLHSGTKIAETSDTIVLQGPFAVGTELLATPHGADFSIRGLITEVVEGETFALRAAVNGLLVTARHTLTPLGHGGTRITHHSEITGPRAETLGPQIGPRITDDHPRAMEDLLAAAQARSV